MLLLLLPVLSALASAVEVKRPRGVSLTNHHFYEESKPFTCLDGSSTIAFDWVNDDYCDCQDGSDEPGTSACPNGRFHCTNAGYRPQYIPSSRVNDGVCDCCDATDEYNSGFVCENTCNMQQKSPLPCWHPTSQQSSPGAVGPCWVALGVAPASWPGVREQAQLGSLPAPQGERGLGCGLGRGTKEAAEKLEKEAKEIHQKNWEGRLRSASGWLQMEPRASAELRLQQSPGCRVSVAELQTHVELDVDGDGTLSETEAQTLLGNALQADASSFQDSVWTAIKENYKPEGLPDAAPLPEAPAEEAPEPQPDLPPEQPAPEDDYDEEEEDEADDDESNEEEPKELPAGVPPPKQPSDKVEEDVEKLPPYDEATQALIDAAQKAREQFEEAEKSLKEMEDSIRNLEKEISFDFGPQGEFAYLYSQCYELSTNE
uniref:PRKCSH beta subunit of glucosidase II n=1 Tax=Pelodiscus sinensis TaxID=13735 RepID=K7FH56_PELSI